MDYAIEILTNEKHRLLRIASTIEPNTTIFNTMLDRIKQLHEAIIRLEEEKHYGISIENIIKTGGRLREERRR